MGTVYLHDVLLWGLTSWSLLTECLIRSDKLVLVSQMVLSDMIVCHGGSGPAHQDSSGAHQSDGQLDFWHLTSNN